MTINKTCTVCGRNFEITDLEQQIRHKVNAPLPKTCTFCRTKNRYKNLPMYGFRKTHCHYCGAEIITSIPSKETRPIACDKCYKEKLLDKIN